MSMEDLVPQGPRSFMLINFFSKINNFLLEKKRKVGQEEGESDLDERMVQLNISVRQYTNTCINKSKARFSVFLH